MITSEDIEKWCDVMEERERLRTFARDDLAPGNTLARKNQALMIKVCLLVRAALAAGL